MVPDLRGPREVPREVSNVITVRLERLEKQKVKHWSQRVSLQPHILPITYLLSLTSLTSQEYKNEIISPRGMARGNTRRPLT